MGQPIFAVLAFSAGLAITAPAAAQAAESPYEEDLLRLSEVLGSLHFLRNLCGEKSETWRGEMEMLLSTENPDPQRKTRLMARFNRGYRAFADNYIACTASATEAISRYMKEGERLARETASRYGN